MTRYVLGLDRPCVRCKGRVGADCLRCHGSGLEPKVSVPRFDGETFDPQRDGPRLTGALEAVRDRMADGRWYTLRELAQAAGCSEAAASARLRDLRKAKFGGYTVEREHVGGGLWRYRLVT